MGLEIVKEGMNGYQQAVDDWMRDLRKEERFLTSQYADLSEGERRSFFIFLFWAVSFFLSGSCLSLPIHPLYFFSVLVLPFCCLFAGSFWLFFLDS